MIVQRLISRVLALLFLFLGRSGVNNVPKCLVGIFKLKELCAGERAGRWNRATRGGCCVGRADGEVALASMGWEGGWRGGGGGGAVRGGRRWGGSVIVRPGVRSKGERAGGVGVWLTCAGVRSCTGRVMFDTGGEPVARVGGWEGRGRPMDYLRVESGEVGKVRGWVGWGF